MTHLDLIKILKDAGITDGFCLHGLEIVIWEHDVDPPAPMTRPKEANIEASIADDEPVASAE